MSINTDERDRELALLQKAVGYSPPPTSLLQSPTAPPRMAPRATSLLPQSTSLPQASNMETANDNSLDEVASIIGSSENVPEQWLINNVIRPMAYHESKLDPIKVQVKSDNSPGPGKGMLQFEGISGTEIPRRDKDNKVVEKNGKTLMGKNPFDVALGRAKSFYTMNDLDVPSWVRGVTKGQDARSLTSNQQLALGLINIKMSTGKKEKTTFKDLYKNFGKDALTDFWKKHHHRGKPNETATTKAARKQSFKDDYSSYVTEYSSDDTQIR
tara:strand:+ start:137 stop:946 length:810 start_codon:yes stop_codon:yes gene_type:complete